MPIQLQPTMEPGDIERIHACSLHLLETVGVRYNTPKALEVLETHGCRVDRDSHHAWLQPDLVEWALSKAPRVVHLQARLPENDVLLDGCRSHHTTDSQGTRAIDFESGEVRPSTLADLEKSLVFADALDMIEIVNVMVAANDVPAHLRTIQHYASAFACTGKHIRTSVLDPDQLPFIIELATLAGGGTFRQIFSTVDCTISPLLHDGPMTEACIELAKMEVPIMIYPMPLAGGTSPVTLAGTILMHNTEFLSGLALFQAAHPGAPLIYGTGASLLDMQTGRYGAGANSYSLGPALSAMARYYDLPVNLNGLSTSSTCLDTQYGHEATAGCMLATLVGADEIFSIGLLGDAQVLSLEKMVLDNQLAHQVETMLEPISFEESRLGCDLIERVGAGGHFLTQRETRDFTRREYIPKWPPAGTTAGEFARQRAQEIYYHHAPPPLPENAQAGFAAVLDRAREYLE